MDDWSRWYDFIHAYHATMSRLQANSHYCFSTDYFEKFRVVLGSHLHLCSILSPDGEVVASGLIIVIDGLVQFHLAATATPYLCKAPLKTHVRCGSPVGAEARGAFSIWGVESGEETILCSGSRPGFLTDERIFIPSE